MLTTDEAFALIEGVGITKNKQTFLRYVREGKIKGEIRHKREGYRFEEKDIDEFIKYNMPRDKINPFEELERLKKENEQLQYKLKVPDSMIQAENMQLAQKLKKANNELMMLKDKVEALKQDKTIRVRVN